MSRILTLLFWAAVLGAIVCVLHGRSVRGDWPDSIRPTPTQG